MNDDGYQCAPVQDIDALSEAWREKEANKYADERERSGSRKMPREAGKQARFLISPASMAHIKRIARRTNLLQNQVVDQLVREAARLEREVKKLGYQHVGEALAVLRTLQEKGGI